MHFSLCLTHESVAILIGDHEWHSRCVERGVSVELVQSVIPARSEIVGHTGQRAADQVRAPLIGPYRFGIELRRERLRKIRGDRGMASVKGRADRPCKPLTVKENVPGDGIDRLGIEHDSIIDNRLRANGTNGTTDAPLPRVAAPGKVEIAGWAVGRLTPQSEKHRPLQNKPAAMLGLAKAVQESLGRVSLQQELKVLILFAAPVQQSGADRCGNVSEWPARHEISACRYAVMTDRARQASAARMISSTVATRRLNASRRASRAMSRPSLLR